MLLLLLPLLAACEGDGAVELTFRPEDGDVLAYETEVESVTSTAVSCEPPSASRDRTTLQTTQRVLEVGKDGVRVEVVVSRPAIGSRTFVVRFDRAAQLTEVEEVEGIPAAALGELGLSEVFPAAAGAPPARPLAPGDRWTIDDDVTLEAGAAPTRLRGEGRLLRLGVEDGRETATVATTATLPVSTESASSTGTRRLDGEQVSEVRATYALGDGALLRADSRTTATYDLVLGPPPGGAGDPCEGTLAVEIRSRVRRVG